VTPDLRSLAAGLADGALLGPDDDMSAYEQPWRGQRGRAAFVARPGTLAEVRDVVRWAVRHRVPLVAQGANTGLVGASVPGVEGSAGVLSTERLVTPFEVHVDDRAVTAGAGVLLSAVEAATSPHRLELPVDLSADASVGGIVATNAGGCRVLRHGDVRRRLLGVQVVLADDDATVLGDLRPLRKKNDTLRLTDLVVGSAGLLGVITAATLELSHRPAERATALVLPGGQLLELCDGLERALGQRLGALELVSGDALRLTVRHLEAVTDPFPGQTPEVVLLVEAEGAGAEDALVEALEQCGDLVEDAAVLPVERAWGLRHGISEALALSGTVLGLDVSLPRGALVAARSEAADVVRRGLPGAVLADFGHVGDGGLHLNVVLPEDHDPAAAAALRHDVYALVARHGGSFSAEHGLGTANVAWWVEHEDPAVRRTLAGVKRVLDPYGLLGTEALRAALTDEADAAEESAR
jgi:FAD/FMN-containing dehydrogenase